MSWCFQQSISCLEQNRKLALKLFPTWEAPPDKKVCLVLRTSCGLQERSLKTYEEVLKQAVENSGSMVIGILKYIWSGRKQKWLKEKLPEIVERAKELNAEVLLFPSLCRIIRHNDYNPTTLEGKHLEPTENQLLEVSEALKGIEVNVLIPADTPVDTARLELASWGMDKNGCGGPKKERRGIYNKELRKEYKTLILERLNCGVSKRQVAKELNISDSTLCDWLKWYITHS